jgi:hypothetical protein
MTKKVKRSGVSFPRDALLAFVHEGCALFPYSGTPLRKLATPVFTAFRAFLRQPEERLLRFTIYVNREGNIEPDDGYIRPGKRADGTFDPAKDRKRYFHYREDFCSRLPPDLVLNAVEKRFLSAVAKLFDVTLRIETEFATALEALLPEYPFAYGVTSPLAKRLHVLRLLAYDASDGKSALAKPHYDRDFATLHVHETDSGLFHGTEGREEAYHPSDEKIFLFAGDKAQVFTGGIPDDVWYGQTGEKIIHGGIIQPRRHLVVPGAEKVVRYSAVHFGHIGTHERPCTLPWK